jgi:hypothetical protein
MGTLNFAGNTAISQKMFVDNRGYPGGPTVYLVEHYDAAPNQMGNAAYIVANFFTDATLVCPRTLGTVLLPDLFATAVSDIRSMEQELRHPSPSLPSFFGIHE